MADFPATSYETRTVANVDGTTYDAAQTTRIFAEDVNQANAEIVAIEETFGEEPGGEFQTVGERLTDAENRATDFFQLYLRLGVGEAYESGGLTELPEGILFNPTTTSNTTRYLSYYDGANYNRDYEIVKGEFTFDFVLNSVADVSALICYGGVGFNLTGVRFGFRVANNILWGIASNMDEDELEVELLTITANTKYNCRFKFDEETMKYRYYVNGVYLGENNVEAAPIDDTRLFTAVIRNNAALAKTMRVYNVHMRFF